MSENTGMDSNGSNLDCERFLGIQGVLGVLGVKTTTVAL